ncbi:SufE family protein [Candidatus Leptofilum sp.]|uniref:SufE family protein n=1 Tax=Candidatus Leptofilum sp. TaxID=3241576 RepID=UPI003B5BA022
MSNLPERLEEIIEDFSVCVGQEKLEYLLEFAEKLPPVPDHIDTSDANKDEVHECISPVFIFPEWQNGKIFYHFDIPEEAPTVRGFASVLQEGIGWTTPEEIQSIPLTFYLGMGLQQVLTGQRLNGITAVLAHMQALSKQ